MVLHTGHQSVGMQLNPNLIQVLSAVEKNAFHQDHDRWDAFHQMRLLCEDQRTGHPKRHSVSKKGHE